MACNFNILSQKAEKLLQRNKQIRYPLYISSNLIKDQLM